MQNIQDSESGVTVVTESLYTEDEREAFRSTLVVPLVELTSLLVVTPVVVPLVKAPLTVRRLSPVQNNDNVLCAKLPVILGNPAL